MKVSFFYIIIDIMEFIERFESTNNQYTRKIKDSVFSRTHTSVKGRWNERYLFTNNFKYGFSVCFSSRTF